MVQYINFELLGTLPFKLFVKDRHRIIVLGWVTMSDFKMLFNFVTFFQIIHYYYLDGLPLS